MHNILQRLQSGELTSQRLLEETVTRLQHWEPQLHSFLALDLEAARRQAADIDARRGRGEKLGVLAGLPVAVKDNLCTTGFKTTAGSRILESFLPPYEATVVARLRAADAIIVGKTNLDEFSMGSSTENSAYGVTRNPWNLKCVPGGSSGGSAAAVAARQVVAALGSDTGGSIRQPAAFCGITGLKPTYGRVSRYGLIAYGSSLDQVGPMAVSAADCALLLEVIAGKDDRDATSADRPVESYVSQLESPCRGLRVGYSPRLQQDLPAALKALFEGALREWEKLGCQLVEVDLPSLEHSLATYYIVAMAEASSNLARYDGIRYGKRVESGDIVSMVKKSRQAGFGAEVKRRILLGTYTLSAGYYDAYYHKAQQVRTLIRNDYEAAFLKVDALALPTTPTTAFAVGEKTSDPLQMYLADVYTVSANLTGLPSLALPCGFQEGLPWGLQLTGPAWSEARLLQLGAAYQNVTDFHLQTPVCETSATPAG